MKHSSTSRSLQLDSVLWSPKQFNIIEFYHESNEREFKAIRCLMFPLLMVFAPPLDQNLEMNTGYGHSYFKKLDLM